MEDLTNRIIDDPLVSIITVCFNSEKTIEGAIQSVVKQTYKNVEYIIIDGNSSDKTIEIINKYIEKVDYFISESDSGIYDAMNKGVTLANGDIVGILNSDDFLEKDALEKIVDSYKKNSNFDIYYGNMKYHDLNKGVDYIVKPLVDVYKYKYGKMPLSHPATFVKKKVYDDIGMFNLKYKKSADYEFILKAIKKRKKFLYIDELVTNMRSGGATQDFKSTFNETREININYGNSKLKANYIFLKSCLKALVVENLADLPILKILYSSYKKGKSQ